MKKVIIGIGIPGSGKTTYLKRLAGQDNYFYLSSDNLREEITGDENAQTHNKEVWEKMYSRLSWAIENNKNVIVDATFADKKERGDIVEFCRKVGAERVEGIFVDVPLDVAKERNLSRERRVPDSALERMNRKLNLDRPDLSEGFDEIFIIDEKGEVSATEPRRNAEAFEEIKRFK